MTKKFENIALFRSYGFIIHTYPSRKQSYSKTVLKPENVENAGSAFSVDKLRTFWKRSSTQKMT